MLMLQGMTPRRTWEFVPPSNRLKAMYRNDHLAAEMMHRTERQVENDVLPDVFDGHHYQELLDRDVSWKDETLSPTEKYFSKDTDVLWASPPMVSLLWNGVFRTFGLFCSPYTICRLKFVLSESSRYAAA
jgi:hypothetical protein